MAIGAATHELDQEGWMGGIWVSVLYNMGTLRQVGVSIAAIGRRRQWHPEVLPRPCPAAFAAMDDCTHQGTAKLLCSHEQHMCVIALSGNVSCMLNQ